MYLRHHQQLDRVRLRPTRSACIVFIIGCQPIQHIRGEDGYSWHSFCRHVSGQMFRIDPNRFGCLQRPATGKDRQPLQKDACWPAEQFITLINPRLQGLVARQDSARAVIAQAKTVRQAHRDLFDWQHFDARRRQFNCQGNANPSAGRFAQLPLRIVTKGASFPTRRRRSA